MTSQQDLQPPLIIITGPDSELPPVVEEGWRLSVSPPSTCNVGLFPYPFVLEGPVPSHGLSAYQKTWEIRTMLFQYSGEVWKEVKCFIQTDNGLGPFANRRAVVKQVYTHEPGTYIVHVLVSLLDETQGKVTRRAMAKSNRIDVGRDHDNAQIQRSTEEEKEVQKILERTPRLRLDSYGYQTTS